jgi:HEAT repeat protein
VRGVMKDAQADIDVRLAAIVAAGQMDKDRPHPSFGKDLHDLLATNDPKLSFTAATTLWANKDTSGQDVLVATAEGERAGDYSFFKRSEHNASRTLHSPEALAKIAMMQSLTILVPPVGMGMGAYGYLKGTPGASPQVTAIEQLAKVHTAEVQKALIVATRTKDAAARIAAAEALSRFSGTDVQEALYSLLDDDKLQVRLTASAAYLKVSAAKAPAREGRKN